jgi:nucleotide-binding universal stress UspA family protein
MRKVLAALDNSLAAEAVLATASNLADAFGGEVEALHVVEDGHRIAHDEAEAAGPPRLDPGQRVLEDGRLGRFHPEPLRRGQERVGRRLAGQALLRRDHAVHPLLDEVLQPGGADHLGAVGR